MGSGTFYPAVGGDDGWRGSASGYNNSTNYLYIGDWSEDFNSWVRFSNITIPQEATITEAFIRFTAYSSRSGTTCNLNCHFNDVDNAVAPGNAAAFDALVLTGAVVWNNVSAWTNGIQYDTPSLISILQNIIDRVGFSSGNAVQIIIKNNSSSTDVFRQPSTFERSSEKPELHVTWEDPPPEVFFIFTNPTPAHLSTVYSTTEQVCLTTTASGEAAEYVYDATFYDEFDVQIGTTVSGINSGSQAASNEYLSTPSGIDYSWYMTATSSGVEDTSPTYTFHNRFLYEGYVTENDNPISRKVNLYYRNTGELIDTTTSSGSNGYYKLSAVNNDTHFIVAFDDEAGEDYNALILDKLLPVGSE